MVNTHSRTAMRLCVLYGSKGARNVVVRSIRSARSAAGRAYWRMVLEQVRWLMDTY